jgi:hypothetical protein
MTIFQKHLLEKRRPFSMKRLALIHRRPIIFVILSANAGIELEFETLASPTSSLSSSGDSHDHAS